MTYIYRFWHHLKYPHTLTPLLEANDGKAKLTGYKKTVFYILLTLILLFAGRDFWGMYTTRLTDLYAVGQTDTYIFARYLSLIGAVIFSILYFCFHYFVIAGLIALLTDIPFKWVQKVQLYVIFVFTIEKLLEFIIFAALKFTTIYSPFSIAALVAQFTSDQRILFFVNQFTLGTIIAIIIQIVFLRQWVDEGKKLLIAKIIVIHIFVAIAIAYLSIAPVYEWVLRGLN